MSNVKLSSTMTELYGRNAQKVFDRLAELDPIFHKFVQDVVYDDLYRLPPLSLKEKSLITVTALLVTHKAEQTRIHFIGFLNQGFSPHTVIQLIHRLCAHQYLDQEKRAMTILENILTDNLAHFPSSPLSDREKALIDSAACVALGDNIKTQNCFDSILKEKTLSVEEIRGVIRHLMIYCGCPSAMNGFAALMDCK